MKDYIIDLRKSVSNKEVEELAILLESNNYHWRSEKNISSYPLRDLEDGIYAIRLHNTKISRSDLIFYKKMYSKYIIITIKESKYLFNNKNK